MTARSACRSPGASRSDAFCGGWGACRCSSARFVPCMRGDAGILRLFGAKVGEKASIQRSARIEFPWNLEIGRCSTIGEKTWVHSLDKVRIGDYVTISQRVFLCTGTHDYTRPEFDMIRKPISIQRGVWIAADVFIGPGVTIGEDAVIGVRSVVLKDMPKGMVCVGHPCVPLKPRPCTVILRPH